MIQRLRAGTLQDILHQGFCHVQGKYESIVVLNVDGEIRALSGRCTHDWSTPLGDYVEDGAVLCPRHGAQYCTKTGSKLLGPAVSNLRVYDVEIESGVVWVLDD